MILNNLLEKVQNGVVFKHAPAFEVYAEGNAMTAKVMNGVAWVNGKILKRWALQDAELIISPADLTHPRIDIVALEVQPLQARIALVIIQGIAMKEPVPPTLTEDQLPLAEVMLPRRRKTIKPTDITDRRTPSEDLIPNVSEAVLDEL